MSSGALDRWLRREVRRDARRVTVEDALVFGRMPLYLWQRSRRFAVTRSVQEALHVGELYLLFLFAQQNVFIAAALIHIVARVVGGAWWGGLEVLRAGVRERARDGRFAAIGSWIRLWLSTARTMAVAVWLVGLMSVILTSRGPLFGIATVYIAVRVFAVGIELPLRAFHGGAYALRRIHQPTWVLMAPSALRVCLVLSFWPFVGLWSIPVSALSGVVLAALLTVRYTRRTYDDLGLWPLGAAGPFESRVRPSWSDVRRTIMPAVSNASAGVGYVWGVALLSVAAFDPAVWLSLFMYLVLAGPLLEGCLSWTKLFYPDLAELEGELLRTFRAKLEHSLIRWSPVVGVITWVPTLFILALLPGGTTPWLVPLTCLFFVVRARLAAFQMVLFCNRRYHVLIVVSLAATLLSASIPLLHDAQKGLLVTALLLLCIIPIQRFRPTTHPPGGVIPLPSAISTARRLTGDGSWILSEFQPGQLLHGSTGILLRSARQNGPIGIDRSLQLLRWRPSANVSWSGPDIVGDLEGRRVQSTAGSAVNALASFRELWPTQSLPAAHTTAQIIAEFQKRFPGAPWSSVDEEPHPSLRDLFTWRERERVLHEAVLYTYGRPPRTALPLDVTALIDGERISTLFFVTRDGFSKVARRQWRSWLRDVAVANALVGVRGVPTGRQLT